MTLIKKIPWRSLAVFTIGLVIGLYLGHKGTFKSIEKILGTKTVSEAINKPTQVSTVNNKVEIGKIKKSDTLNINFKPVTDQKPIQIISNDTCIDITAFKDWQKKKIYKWDKKK